MTAGVQHVGQAAWSMTKTKLLRHMLLQTPVPGTVHFRSFFPTLVTPIPVQKSHFAIVGSRRLGGTWVNMHTQARGSVHSIVSFFRR